MVNKEGWYKHIDINYAQDHPFAMIPAAGDVFFVLSISTTEKQINKGLDKLIKVKATN